MKPAEGFCLIIFLYVNYGKYLSRFAEEHLLSFITLFLYPIAQRHLRYWFLPIYVNALFACYLNFLTQ